MQIEHKKNTAYYLSFPLVDITDPQLYRTGESVTVEAWYKDGDGPWTAFVPADPVSEIGASGVYELDLTASELNHDRVFIKFSAANSATTSFTFDMRGSLAEDFAGGGAVETPINIKTKLGAPLANVQVWVTTDAVGSNVVAGTLSTNASGAVTPSFMLDAGDYYLQLYKAGVVFDARPYAFTVPLVDPDFLIGELAAVPAGALPTSGLDVVEAGTPARDGCPVLGRMKLFMVDEGVRATLQHTFTDRQGLPVDLDAAYSENPGGTGPAVKMRIREVLGANTADLTYEVDGVIVDGEGGVVQALLPLEVANDAGIYQTSFAYLLDDEVRLINKTLTSVERSLFGDTATDPYHIAGPPTINELRMQIMDYGGDNLLLDDVEFTDDHILHALVKPVDDWNVTPPPLRPLCTTKNFPYRDKWLDAAVGYLYQFAAAHYRRNRLALSGGGLTVDDKNKEREYLQASQLMLSQWKEWLRHKKVQLNGELFFGVTT